MFRKGFQDVRPFPGTNLISDTVAPTCLAQFEILMHPRLSQDVVSCMNCTFSFINETVDATDRTCWSRSWRLSVGFGELFVGVGVVVLQVVICRVILEHRNRLNTII